jgi:hypothetical protein
MNMDRLAKEILAEVKANPGREFSPKDLSHLQSIADVQMQMMWLYENGYVGGDVNPPSNPNAPSTISIKFIVYHK